MSKPKQDDQYTDLFAAFGEQEDNARVTELMRLIRYHRNLYYNDPENTEISDEEFDAYVDELTDLDPNNKVLFEVGAPVDDDSAFTKGTHNIPMTSLDKVNTVDQMSKWMRDRYATQVCVQEKLDGFSCLDGDTLVLLANGERVPIRDLVERQVEAEVLTWSPEKGHHTAPLTAFHNNGVKDNWVRITFEPEPEKGIHLGLTMVVTEDHKFFVESRGWVEAKDLVAGDDVKDA